MSIIKNKTPILGINNEIYTNMILEKKRYYFLSESSNNIDIYDETLHFIAKIEMKECYDNITFRKEKELFYFYSNKGKITITNEKFKIIKEINCNLNKACVKGMCYLEKEDILYLLTNDYIALIDGTYKINKTLTKKQISRNEKIINEFMYMKQFPISNFTAIAFIEEELYVAYIRENESYIAKIKNKKIIDEHFIDVDSYIRSIVNCNGMIKLLISKRQNYIYETNICVEKKEFLKQNISEEEKDKAKCVIKKKEIKETSNYLKTKEYNSNCKEHCSENCICSVMESIAKEEVRNF